MTLFAYADDPTETAIACICGHTCGHLDTCTMCQPQPTLRRCRACKRGGQVIVDAPPPGPIEPPALPPEMPQMAASAIVIEMRLSARGCELYARLRRLAAQAKQSSRRKMSRLMREGSRIAERYLQRPWSLVVVDMELCDEPGRANSNQGEATG